MKTVKRILAIVLALSLVLALAACGTNDEPARVAQEVSYDGAAITIARSGLAADFGLVKLLDSDVYSFTDEDVMLAAPSADLAVVPLWRAAQLVNENESAYQILALNTFGTYSILVHDETVNTAKDLANKTILIGQAEPADEQTLSRVNEAEKAIVEKILAETGVTAAVQTEAAATVYEKVAAGDYPSYVILPEPYATLASANTDCDVVLTITNAWSEAGVKEPLTENCILAKQSFLQNNKAGVEKFVADLRASVEWVNLNPVDAADLLIEKEMVSADVLNVSSALSDKKQEAAVEQQKNDLIARANVIYMDGSAMIDSANAVLAAYDLTLPDSAFYLG